MLTKVEVQAIADTVIALLSGGRGVVILRHRSRQWLGEIPTVDDHDNDWVASVETDKGNYLATGRSPGDALRWLALNIDSITWRTIDGMLQERL